MGAVYENHALKRFRFVVLTICAALVCVLFSGWTTYQVIGKGPTFSDMLVYETSWIENVHRAMPEETSVSTMETDLYRNRYHEEIGESSALNIRIADGRILDFLEQLEVPMTDAERIDNIANWVTANLHYDKNYIYRGIGDSVVDGRGVCWHYSYLMKLLCDAYNIDCEVIEGYRRDERHAWNVVYLNSSAYYFDLTWEDCYADMPTTAPASYRWLSMEEMGAIN